MTPAELQKILQSDDKLTVKQVKEAIKELHEIAIADYRVETRQTTKQFYDGQVNAFYICLDLLEKVEEK